MDVVAQGLTRMWKVLLPEPAHRKEQATQILQWCVQDEEKMVAEAMQKGVERNAELTPGGSPVSGAGASLPEGIKPRALVRMDTNEEYERVRKKRLGK